jgi:hypothetical protein
MDPQAVPLTEGDRPRTLAQGMAYLRHLVVQHRVEALWFLREDWLPLTPEDGLKACRYLQRAVDRATWQELELWRRWLLQHCNSESAGS